MKKIMLVAALAMVTSTVAQAADTYYIVQDVKTKKCTVVEKKPTTKTTIIVDGDKVYKTKTEADEAIKSVKVCTSE